MCGIAGFLDTTGQLSREEMLAIVAQMGDTLHHRGPDDSGAWVEASAGIAMGHRRLSIVDLSPEGHQPMHSACGRYVISFNGEIYNYELLREELASGYGESALNWRGHSDTEVILSAIRRWGLEAAVSRFNGMFAIALWDRQERLLHLVRDRLGKKPLYYGWMGGTFLFASELKALRAHPSFRSQIDRDSVALYLRHSYIPTPYSVYKGISKLSQGTIITVDAARPGIVGSPTHYWSVKETAENGASTRFGGSLDEATNQLEALLMDAVRLRMIADVPLGAFLSGGIDSSVVVALMQAQSAMPVRTFTIGFQEAAYDEADHARAVAKCLGTDHTDLYVTPRQALDVIPRLPILFDEPFSDSSQIPMFLVSEMARQHVKVSLSGDGGDELLFGYPRYLSGLRRWARVEWMGTPCRRAISKTLALLDACLVDPVLGTLPMLSARRSTGSSIQDRLRRVRETVACASHEEFYWRQFCHWGESSSVVLHSADLPTAFTDRSRQASLPTLADQMMYLDSVAYLPDDILVKVDRASMGASLEARAPLLDHRVVELAWRLPIEMKTTNDQGKTILRQLLYRYVPRELIERPKMGFGVPIGLWLRGPLRDWAEDLLSEHRLRSEGFFDPQPIRAKWLEHLSGRRNWQYHLWDVLMFQAWLSEWES